MNTESQEAPQVVDQAPQVAEPNVEALVQSIEQSSTESEGDDYSQVNEVLSSKFGVTVDKIDELKSYQEKFEKTNAEYEKAKVQYENRYSSPLSEKIDVMLGSGASLKEVNKFLSLQELNLAEMSPEDTIKQKMSLERPYLSQKEIDRLFADEFPDLDEDAEDFTIESRNVKVKTAAHDAKAFLEEQRVAAENPKAVQQRQMEQQRIAKLQSNYGTIADALMKDVKQVSYKVEDQSFGEYSFDFKIPENESLMKEVRDAVVNDAIKNGLPFDDRGVNEMRNSIVQVYQALNHKQIVESVVRDAYASITKKVVTEQSNSAPVPRGSGAANTSAPKVREVVHENDKGHKFV